MQPRAIVDANPDAELKSVHEASRQSIHSSFLAHPDALEKILQELQKKLSALTDSVNIIKEGQDAIREGQRTIETSQEKIGKGQQKIEEITQSISDQVASEKQNNLLHDQKLFLGQDPDLLEIEPNPPSLEIKEIVAVALIPTEKKESEEKKQISLFPEEPQKITAVEEKKQAPLSPEEAQKIKALHELTQAGHTTIAHLLETKNISSSAHAKEVLGAFVWAAENNRLDITCLLLAANADIDLVYRRTQNTALLVAIQMRNVNMVRFLLEANANPNLINEQASGKTPLTMAVWLGRNNPTPDIVRALLDAKANPDFFEPTSPWNILSIAEEYARSYPEQYDCAEIVTMLREASSNNLFLAFKASSGLTRQEIDKTRELVFAAAHHMLLALNRSPGLTPREISKTRQLIFAVHQGNMSLVRTLLQERARTDLIVNKEGITPLIAAVSRGNVNAVRALLDARANPNFSKSSRVWSYEWQPFPAKPPLMQAVDRNQTEIAGVLLNAKANVDLMYDFKQETALLLAIQNGNFNMARLLLKANANPNLCDRHRTTSQSPLAMAIGGSNHPAPEFIRALLDAKADPTLSTPCSSDPHGKGWSGLSAAERQVASHPGQPPHAEILEMVRAASINFSVAKQGIFGHNDAKTENTHTARLHG